MSYEQQARNVLKDVMEELGDDPSAEELTAGALTALVIQVGVFMDMVDKKFKQEPCSSVTGEKPSITGIHVPQLDD